MKFVAVTVFLTVVLAALVDQQVSADSEPAPSCTRCVRADAERAGPLQPQASRNANRHSSSDVSSSQQSQGNSPPHTTQDKDLGTKGTLQPAQKADSGSVKDNVDERYLSRPKQPQYDGGKGQQAPRCGRLGSTTLPAQHQRRRRFERTPCQQPNPAR